MSAESVARVLESIGVEVFEVRGDSVIGRCPGHEERVGRPDNRPSWSMSAAKRLHHCFSCGFSGTLAGLVAQLKGLADQWGQPDYAAAERIIAGELDIPMSEIVAILDRALEPEVEYRPLPIGEAHLAGFDFPPQRAIRDRRLSTAQVERYGVLWQDGNWILPLRDPDTGHLLGWQEKGHRTRHFHNRPAGLRKSETLFGIREWSGPSMAVVESPLDAVRLAGLGYPAVATCGASVSEYQFRLMRLAERLVLAFDNDDAGRKALQHGYELSRREGFEFWSFDYAGSGRKDVGDMEDDEIRSGMQDAVHCVRGIGVVA